MSARFTPERLRAMAILADRGMVANACAALMQAADDAERLEWIVEHRGTYHVMGSDERGWAVMDGRNGLSIKTRGHQTMREAIDAVRKEPTP